MTTHDPCNTMLEQEEKVEKTVELSPSKNLPMEKTVYVSSRTPLHDFELNDLVWGSRKLLQTRPKSTNNWTPLSKLCLKAKPCKRQSVSRPVNKEVLKVVRERRVRRREGLLSLSLREEQIEEDFVRVTGRMPARKMKVKVFDTPQEKQEYVQYQKYLKEIVPGNWLSGIYGV
ncbi:uncharacterized protein LOC141670655 [Apium graveolens]|uniref:uncharacterized protein LOC141670655 n=1 Tax=Apium graveolens TaxID=4045 RepID=UPI003D7A4330